MLEIQYEGSRKCILILIEHTQETWKKEVIALEIIKVILLDFCSVAASITLFSL